MFASLQIGYKFAFSKNSCGTIKNGLSASYVYKYCEVKRQPELF